MSKARVRPVDDMPKPFQPRTKIDWDHVATLAVDNPGKRYEVGEGDILMTQVKSARQYKRYPFNQEGFRIMIRESYDDENGVRRGRVFVEYEPEEQKGKK